MPINSDVKVFNSTLEYQKFGEIINDTNFPPISVTRTSVRDNGQVDTQITTYPKYAVLTYDVGTNQSNSSPFGDNSSLDAFGRLRVSSPSTLLDSKMLYSKQGQTYDEVLSGTATSTFSAFDSCVVMKTSNVNDLVIRQTRPRFNYQPGKSMQFMFTGLFTPEPNIIKRVGCFQSLSTIPYEPVDGMWLEVLSSGPVLRVQKSLGTVHSETAPQSAWNIDRLDGTGPSGLSLDFNSTQLFSIDYEWLGVGRVRFGFYINGKLYYCHADAHAEGLTAPYMSYSNQPVRYEIRQTGSGTGLMKQICSTVLSEGGEDDVGSLLTVATTGAAITVTSNTGETSCILGVRNHPDQVNLINAIKNIEVFNASSKLLIYQLALNPTFTSPVTWVNADAGVIQQVIGSSTLLVTNPGYILLSNFASPNNRGGFSQTDIARVLGRLGASVNNTPDSLFLIGRFLDNTSGSSSIYASLNILSRA